MRKSWLLPLPAILLWAFLRPVETASAPPPERDRSPCGVALSANGHWAVTANGGADSASLVDVASGKVVAETPVGRRPFDVALSAGGKRAIVTNWLSDSVSVLAVSPDALRVVRTIPVGDEPRGVALSPDGSRAYVALGGEDAVAVVDLKTMTVARRIPVGVEPWHLALTPDGAGSGARQLLAVANVRGASVSVIETAGGTVAHTVRTNGVNLRHVAVSPDARWAYLPFLSDRGFPATKVNIDRGWVVGSRLARVPLGQPGPREAIALDPRGKAFGDVDGLALSPDGQTIAITAGGTHELLLLRQPLRFLAYGGPGDHIERELLDDPTRFRRIPLGGRPLAVRFAPDGKTVVVANYLSNALQVVDVQAGIITKTIALGGPAEPSLARRGQAIFHDAERSFNQWYSCSTCHVEGHTNGGSFDTFNDKKYNVLKKTPSLRGVAQTAPYMWHGWQKDLRTSLRESIITSMQGPEPTEADLDALLAYVKTLDWVPSPHRNPDGTLTAAAKRGQSVFQAKACATCHAGPDFTNPGVFTVGLESPDDALKGFNPPPLRGVYSRSPYLHDGRAKTLEEVLTEHHRPSQLTGKPDLTPKETADLIAYLKSL